MRFFSREILSIFTYEQNVIADGAAYLSVVCFSYVFFCFTQALVASMRSYVFRIDRRLKLKTGDLLKTDPLLRRDFIRYSLPIVGGNLVWGINLMGNSIILGQFDQYVISAASITNTLNTLAFVTFNGMAAAIGIIIGKMVGARKIEKVKE